MPLHRLCEVHAHELVHIAPDVAHEDAVGLLHLGQLCESEDGLVTVRPSLCFPSAKRELQIVLDGIVNVQGPPVAEPC